MNSRTAAGASLAVVGIVVGGVLGAAERVVPSSAPAEALIPSGEVSMVEVHVAGWVVSPGVVAVAESSIVADAIDLAGGFRIGASVDQINLAAPVRGGDQIVVPGPDDVLAGGFSDGLIVINQAGSSDLQALPGVGPVLADRIVAYREQNGPFTQVEDLLQVPGIGEAKLASIRDLIRVP